jgi:hypothetical protein
MDRIADFWMSFLDLRKRLEQLTTADDPVYDDVLSRLQEIHPEPVGDSR